MKNRKYATDWQVTIDGGIIGSYKNAATANKAARLLANGMPYATVRVERAYVRFEDSALGQRLNR